MRWTKDEDGRFVLSVTDSVMALTWSDLRDLYPRGIRQIDWPRFTGGHEVSYQHGIASSVDADRGPWEWGTCRYCHKEVRLWMMEPEMCPVGPEWMRTSDDYTGPTFREMED